MANKVKYNLGCNSAILFYKYFKRLFLFILTTTKIYMPTQQEQEQRAIKNILESLNKINKIKPNFIEQYLLFLETNKPLFKPSPGWVVTLKESLGPTYSNTDEYKKLLENLTSVTQKFLDISKPLDPAKSSGAKFNVNALINAINEMGRTPLPPQTNLQSPGEQPMQQEGQGQCSPQTNLQSPGGQPMQQEGQGQCSTQ